MDFDRYSRDALETIADDPAALRARADQLQDDILHELYGVWIEQFRTIVAELNRRGHSLTDPYEPKPDEAHVRDHTNPDLCALRLACNVTISAGFEDVLLQGGRGETPGLVKLLARTTPHTKSDAGTMKHADRVEKYPGSLVELTEELGNLRYDALAVFLTALSAKLEADSLQDAARGRKKLATTLHAASGGLVEAATAIERAWTICEPHMK